MFDLTIENHPRWPTLSDEDRQALDNLEEMAGEVNAEEMLRANGNADLAQFASEVYRALHWVSAPHCRKNHPDWNPGAKVADAACQKEEGPDE